MAPAQMDYQQNANVNESQPVAAAAGYTHKKFNTGCYKHKKFGKRISNKQDTPTAPALFRPYALSENTPRKRRQQVQEQQLEQAQHQLPPTPPTTPPQQQQQYQAMPQQMYTPTATPIQPIPTTAATPVINHQALAYMLQKQRAVLQMRQMLSINPDASTWPAELRNALYAMLQQ
ncbi:hypothetical protein KR222_001712 [Zaprionus bogoriensis]|nr:hypothetical protein KR222_001712 [Zaprionus bogoriensis]